MNNQTTNVKSGPLGSLCAKLVSDSLCQIGWPLHAFPKDSFHDASSEALRNKITAAKTFPFLLCERQAGQHFYLANFLVLLCLQWSSYSRFEGTGGVLVHDGIIQRLFASPSLQDDVHVALDNSRAGKETKSEDRFRPGLLIVPFSKLCKICKV